MFFSHLFEYFDYNHIVFSVEKSAKKSIWWEQYSWKWQVQSIINEFVKIELELEMAIRYPFGGFGDLWRIRPKKAD